MRLSLLISSLLLFSTSLFGAPPELKLAIDKERSSPTFVVVRADTTAKTVKLKVVGDAVSYADSNGKIVVVSPTAEGKGSVSVIGVAASETGEISDIVELVVTTEDTRPKPTPKPPVPPVPDVNTPSKLFLVVIEETEAAVAERGTFFANKALATQMKDKGHKWRVVDQNVTGQDGKPPADVVPFLKAATGKTLPQLFLVDEKGKTRFSGDMPSNPTELGKLLIQYGG